MRNLIFVFVLISLFSCRSIPIGTNCHGLYSYSIEGDYLVIEREDMKNLAVVRVVDKYQRKELYRHAFDIRVPESTIIQFSMERLKIPMTEYKEGKYLLIITDKYCSETVIFSVQNETNGDYVVFK